MKNVFILILLLIILGCSSYDIKQGDTAIPSNEEDKGLKPIVISEFTVGPGDVIDIVVWRHNELSKKIQIDPYGKFMYPLIGEINANGISVSKLSGIIKEGLSNYLVNPDVSVSIVSIQSQKVYVVGEVTKPGAFSFDTPMSAIEAISRAGGFTTDAKDESVMVIRGNRKKPELIKLDLESALEDGNIAQNIQLQGGDIVYVPATFIADVSRFSLYLRNILTPILMFEQGVRIGPSW